MVTWGNKDRKYFNGYNYIGQFPRLHILHSDVDNTWKKHGQVSICNFVTGIYQNCISLKLALQMHIGILAGLMRNCNDECVCALSCAC